MISMQQRLLAFSEKAFSFNFIALTFVMFSCLFPTGFASVFSSLAFIFGLLILFSRLETVDMSYFEKSGLLLFVWLTISILWSSAPLSESIGYLSEYRIYFMLPVYVTALTARERTRNWALVAGTIGSCIALVASYGLGLSWWTIEGANLSLGDRIYHGFIMSFFMLGGLLLARERNGLYRILAILIVCAIFVNVLLIEKGRTGYLLAVLILIIIGALTFTRAIFCVLAVFGCLVLLGLYLNSDRLHSRVNVTLSEVKHAFFSNNIDSSAGFRLEMYRNALVIGSDHAVVGVGVGDVVNTLESKSQIGELRVRTDNVHSEFLNMFIAGGIPALILFISFIFSIGISGVAVRNRSRPLSHGLFGVCMILLISSLFNSTIKDFGEKHVLLIVLSILGSYLVSLQREKKRDVG